MMNQGLLEPIEVNMLGTFSFRDGETVLLEDEGKSRKIWNLLAYLLVHRGKKLSPTELPELLCSDDRSDDPTNVVKNLVYRLRKLLASSQLPQGEFIIQNGGIYKWNNEISVKVDVDDFLSRYKEATKKEMEPDMAIALYLEALALYKGRFLPELAYEEWTTTLRVYYHRIFTDCIKGVYQLFQEAGEFGPMIEICEKAIALDPFDEEIYAIYINSLIQMNREKQALKAYEEITARLYNEMGVNPSLELKRIYKEILKKIKNVEMDLFNIKLDLNELEANEGTFCTDYEIFKGIYRFMARSVERTGVSVFIMLYTITDKTGEVPKPEPLQVGMTKLKNAIQSALRKGDTFAQYSMSQYIIILHGTDYENGLKVGERILKAYQMRGVEKTIAVDYKLQPLDPKGYYKAR